MTEQLTLWDDEEDEALLQRAALLIPETKYDLDPDYRGIRTRQMRIYDA